MTNFYSTKLMRNPLQEFSLMRFFETAKERHLNLNKLMHDCFTQCIDATRENLVTINFKKVKEDKS